MTDQRPSRLDRAMVSLDTRPRESMPRKVNINNPSREDITVNNNNNNNNNSKDMVNSNNSNSRIVLKVHRSLVRNIPIPCQLVIHLDIMMVTIHKGNMGSLQVDSTKVKVKVKVNKARTVAASIDKLKYMV